MGLSRYFLLGLVVICGIKCAVVAVLVVVVAAVVPVAAAAAVVVEIVEAAEEYGTWASARSSLVSFVNTNQSFHKRPLEMARY